MIFGAINYHNNLAYLIAFSLGSLAIMSLIHTYRNLAGLVIRPGKNQAVFAGHKAIFAILVHNNQPRARQAISLRTSSWQCLMSLSGQETSTICISQPAKSRGLKTCPRITISSVYPFGLFRSLTRVRPDVSCLVYPRPIFGQDILKASHAPCQETERFHKTAPGVAEFQDHKTYESGESSKKIDWKAYAKGHGLLSKQFAEAVHDQVWFNYDALLTFDPETRLSLLTGLILNAKKRQQTYGLRLPNQQIGPSSGQDHLQDCLRALALFEPGR
jgi:uncharacterized protein (DUF58 family)